MDPPFALTKPLMLTHNQCVSKALVMPLQFQKKIKTHLIPLAFDIGLLNLDRLKELGVIEAFRDFIQHFKGSNSAPDSNFVMLK
jgi:hypothetical protein